MQGTAAERVLGFRGKNPKFSVFSILHYVAIDSKRGFSLRKTQGVRDFADPGLTSAFQQVEPAGREKKMGQSEQLTSRKIILIPRAFSRAVRTSPKVHFPEGSQLKHRLHLPWTGHGKARSKSFLANSIKHSKIRLLGCHHLFSQPPTSTMSSVAVEQHSKTC